MRVFSQIGALLALSAASAAVATDGGFDTIEFTPRRARRPGPEPADPRNDDTIRTGALPKRPYAPRMPDTPADQERLRLAAMKRARKAQKRAAGLAARMKPRDE